MGYSSTEHTVAPMDANASRDTGEMLKRLRMKQGLTQVQVAERLGVYQSRVAKLENGERSLHVSELLEYANALGVSAHAIVDALEQMESKKHGVVTYGVIDLKENSINS